MPRKYYRRKYSYRPKKKWASNFFTYADEIPWPAVVPNDIFAQGFETKLLFANPTFGNSNAATSVLKVKNCRVQFASTGFADPTAAGVLSLQVALIYVPEDVDLNVNVLTKHPEWILAHKLVTCDGHVSNPINFTISSRLARNLNSGDRIELVFIPRINIAVMQAYEINPGSMAYYATVQYWTSVN